MSETKVTEQTPPDPEVEPRSDANETTHREQGGPQGLEPTRYGDWEKNGRCIDF